MRLAFFAGDGDNFNFVRDLVEHFRQKGCEVRVVKGASGKRDLILENMKWSDVSWFEFANGPIIDASHLPKCCKVICRVHRYEVFYSWPRFIDWSKVDHLIFVSPFVVRALKEIHSIPIERLTKVHVIPIGIRLESFTYRKRKPGYRIASITRFHPDKNPALLLQVMAKLAEIDQRYKCFIIGRVQDPLQ